MKFPELLTLEWLGMDLCREARTQKCFVSGLTEEILSLSLYLPGPQLWSAESGSGEISATIFHGPFRYLHPKRTSVRVPPMFQGIPCLGALLQVPACFHGS